MAFHVNSDYSVPVIEIEGKFLGSVEGAPFVAMLNKMKTDGTVQAVIDLSKTDFLDSSGIGVLIEAAKNMRNVGGDLRLAALQKRIKGVFIMSKLLGSVFQSYDTTEDAIASFEGEVAST
jgi:anti-sigma B factor antagonist